jgi:peptide/nickel transport system substrate-binding protein
LLLRRIQRLFKGHGPASTGGTRALKRVLLAAGVVFLSFTAAFAAAGRKDTFIYAIDGDPGNAINVITTEDRFGLMSIKLLYSPLYMFNGPKDRVLFLAESVTPSKDFLTYTVKLRKNVRWHDGQPLTADDVVFTYEQMLKQSNGGWAYGQMILGGKPIVVKKVDAYTVTFTFPLVSMAAEELIGDIFIMPKHIFENEQNIATSPKNATPVGTGPYKLKEYKAGEYIKFEADPNYFLGAPKIKNVVFRIISDPNTAGLALKNGEVDALVVLPSEADKYKSNPNLSIIPYEEGRIGYVAFRVNNPAAANKDLRQALAYGINREDVLKASFMSLDYAKPAYTILPRKAPYYSEKVNKYAFSLARAKELLAQSGLKNPKLRLAYPANSKAYSAQAMVIQQEAKAVGITVELVGMDGSALDKALRDKKSNDFDLYLDGYIMGIDPDTFNGLFVSTDPSNFMNYKNPALDELFNKGRVETNLKKRAVIYADIQKIIMDDVPILPLVENKRILVINSRIDGLKAAGLVPVYTFEDMSRLFFR